MAETNLVIRTYEAADGYRLHYRHWQPAGRTRGRVVYLHGIQSHGDWYERSSRRLCEGGFEVLFPDRRGSGLNAQERGHAPSAELLLDDVCRLVEPLRDAAPPVPILLLAVSWGAKLAVPFARRKPELIDALGLLYPGFFPRIHPRLDQRLMLRFAGTLGLKRRPVRIPLNDPALFTDVPGFRDYIAGDALALHQVTVGFLLESMALDQLVGSAAGEIRLPTLLMLAGRDQIIDNTRTRRFFDTLASHDKRLIEYPEAQHTLEFQNDPEPFLRDLINWARSAAQGSLLRARAASGIS